MRSYCLNYYTTNYLPIYNGIVLQHKLFEGVIPAATYWRWSLQLTSGVITKISLSRRLNGIEIIKIQVLGKEGQVNSLTDPTDGSYSSDLYVSSGILNFEPDKLIVESVYTQISYNEEYNITFLEYSSSESTLECKKRHSLKKITQNSFYNIKVFDFYLNMNYFDLKLFN